MGHEKTVAMKDVVSAESDEEREGLIKALIARMTLDEKINEMSGKNRLLNMAVMAFRYNFRTYDAGGNKRLGIPAMRFTDGPRGVSLNHSTCFPVSMARGATWDPELEERIGDAIGIESRAQGANYFGGVCINLLRHPGWGRAQETYGEDPHHLGAMGAALTRGVQKHMMACAKHYACNSIEEARFFVNVKVDERTLREIYLPHFKKCVDAGVASIMSAYNRVNGKFCGHNSHLLKEILKGDWGFKGFVISDFLLGVRHARAGTDGGLDVEMPFTIRYGRRLKKLVFKGEVSEDTIDESVTRIIRQKARFAGVGDPAGYDKGKVACKEHVALALEAARKSIVLLKNENRALPLNRDELKTIAVIGELAGKANLGDNGSSRVYPPYSVSPLKGIRDRAGASIKIIYSNGKDVMDARKAVRGADAVIVVAGFTHKDEGEHIPVLNIGGDRAGLDLPAGQEILIRAAAEENKRVIVVLEGGSAITMESWKHKVQAILMAWYPGMEGGAAIADVLFGDVNPSGKLPIVFPKSIDQLPPFDKKAKSIEYGYFHGYRLFDKKGLEPAFPFGFGLSYTQYRCHNLKLSRKSIGKNGRIDVCVDVTNAGETAGDEVVQFYAGCKDSAVDRPVKELKGFRRITLEPGETKTLTMEVGAADLAYYDVDSSSWKIEEKEYTIYVGPSSNRKDLIEDGFKISGD